MEKTKKTLWWIDKRIENYLSLLTHIVQVYTKDDKKSKKAKFLLRTALRTAFFLDFHSETNDSDFLKEASGYRELMYSNISKKDRQGLELVEAKIIKLFDYEKQIWTKIKKGQQVSNEEIEKFWQMKSADALFYSKVIKIFTGDKDFTLPIYVYTQILDVGLDFREYEKDFQKNSPNILYMKLSQKVSIDQIPQLKKDAIKEAVSLGVHLDLEEIVEKLAKQVSNFDFGACPDLKEAIKQRHKEFYEELFPT